MKEIKSAESLARKTCNWEGHLEEENSCNQCFKIAQVITQVRAERLEEIKLQCSDCGMICDNLGQHIFCGKCQDKDFESRQKQIAELTASLERCREALKNVVKNDKSFYEYYGGNARNRNGELPNAGQRFATPKEIAEEALCEETGKKD